VETQLENTQAYECGGDTPLLEDEDAGGDPIMINVIRIGGQTRYHTAQLISVYPGLNNPGAADINGDADSNDGETTAIVASGENFPDALAGGPFAYSGDNNCCGGELPMLLSRVGAVPPETMAALSDLNVVNVVVLGGTVAISDAAVAQLTAAGYTVRRIAGTTRQGTAVALATAMIKEWGYDSNGASIARGDDFPDSLTGGPVSGNSNEVILLTGSPTALSTETTNLLRTWGATFDDEVLFFEVYGGTVAVGAGVVQEIVNAASQQ
jgi:putative cell wall-binding protein